ncbi:MULTISPECIES: hypothetical protein [Butyricimonas]|uniref:hypothetical protein n=1 Tax=Butyricimonas TaxID=574697 RepID=UPI001D0808F0|nr:MULTISPECIES: hypothetical protein [Butyricimonas]MCB6972030.1 hypothetical protein [Butyricimonas synergistica]MCG4519038.1 hypothetical protein [Butyricimonas sp. DFI.6.44]
MNNELLERLKTEYGEEDDVIQLYEEWGETPYLQEIFQILDRQNSDWTLERELGSWAAEFILDILQEHEEELENLSVEDRGKLFEEEIDERYADFKSCRQFARVNNLSIQFEEDEDTDCQDLDEYIAEDGEEIGFPRY